MKTATPPAPSVSLAALAPAICRAFGFHSEKHWIAAPIHPDENGSNYYLTRADGLKLFLAGSAGGWAAKGRITVSLSRPRDAKGGHVSLWGDSSKGENPGQIADPSITVAENANAERIAAEIERRLLPEAERVHGLAVASVARSDAYASGQIMTLCAVASAAGLPEMPKVHRENAPRFSFYVTDRPGEDNRAILASVEIRGPETVRIEIDGNRAQAEALIAFLRSPAYLNAAAKGGAA